MPYKKTVGADCPGMFLFLLDQSGSMVEPFSGSYKQTVAANVLNNVIEEIGKRSLKEDVYSPRCKISVIGYGDSVNEIIGGMIPEIMQNPIGTRTKDITDRKGEIVKKEYGIWVEPRAENGTPMTEAFELAFQKVGEWISNHPDCFPPVIINITDGKPNHTESARSAAERLKELSTTDGNVLLMNAHIEETPADALLVPTESELPQYVTDDAKFLFEISSVIPENLIELANSAGLNAKSGSRGFMYRADATALIKLIKFGSTMGGVAVFDK